MPVRTVRALIAVAVLGAAASTLAGDIYVGGSRGEIVKSTPQGTTVVFPTLCTQIRAMASIDQDLLVADALGNFWKVNTVNRGVTFRHLPFTATAMAVHGGDALIGGEDGLIRRVRIADGSVLATLNAGTPVHAMAVVGDTLYAGGHSTLVVKGNARTGGFQVIAACQAQVSAMAILGDTLAVGALDGNIYRFDPVNGLQRGTFDAGTNGPVSSLLADGAFLVAGGDDGLIRWLRASGEPYYALPMCFDVDGAAAVSACVGDANRDARLDIQDFLTFQNAFAANSPHADADPDGSLDIFDLIAFQNSYAAGCR